MGLLFGMSTERLLVITPDLRSARLRNELRLRMHKQTKRDCAKLETPSKGGNLTKVLNPVS